MASVRTFIAFNTPEAIRESITAFQSELRNSGADVRWESSDKFHVTIKFLGNVDESQLPGLTRKIQSACENYRSFEVWYRGAGGFPDLKHPRVIWLGCENEDGTLANLKSSLDRVLLPDGFEIEERPFRPHITLGRIRSPKGLHYLTPKLENLTFEPQMGTIREVLVVKSVLRPQGAAYTVLSSIQLQS